MFPGQAIPPICRVGYLLRTSAVCKFSVPIGFGGCGRFLRERRGGQLQPLQSEALSWRRCYSPLLDPKQGSTVIPSHESCSEGLELSRWRQQTWWPCWSGSWLPVEIPAGGWGFEEIAEKGKAVSMRQDSRLVLSNGPPGGADASCCGINSRYSLRSCLYAIRI